MRNDYNISKSAKPRYKNPKFPTKATLFKENKNKTTHFGNMRKNRKAVSYKYKRTLTKRFSDGILEEMQKKEKGGMVPEFGCL